MVQRNDPEISTPVDSLSEPVSTPGVLVAAAPSPAWNFNTTLALAGISSAKPTPRAECSPLQLVFAAGTGEKGLGLAGEPLSEALGAAIPGTTTYALPYDTSVEYDTTLVAAANSVQQYFASQSAACPDQKFVFGGYSKGAMVVHRTSLPDPIKSKVVALVMFGDPYLKYQTTEFENAWPIVNPKVNLQPGNTTISGANVASFCNSGDIICDLVGNAVEPHLAYGTDGSATKAASFVKGVYSG
ncbi:Cutinase, partial [Rhizoctonia solani]